LVIRSTEIGMHRTYGRELDSELCVSCGWSAFSHSLDPKRPLACVLACGEIQGESDMEARQEQSESSPFALWGAAATVVGLASDLLRPLGNFALFLLVLCVGATLTLYLLSRRRPQLKRSVIFAAIGAAVFGMVSILQALAPSDDTGVARGFIASTVTPVAAVQSAVLNVPPPAARAAVSVAPPTKPEVAPAPAVPKPAVPSSVPVGVWVPPATKEGADFDSALQVATADADAGNRVRAARFALGSPDPAFQSAVIERLYRAPYPELRQTAITAIFQARTGRAQFPLTVVDAEGNDPELANQLQGASLYVTRVDEVTGGVSGILAGNNPLSGSVTRTGITFSSTLAGRGAVTLLLQPTDDFSLKGSLRTQEGKTVQVQLPLM
jgi:hypothetical protein